MTLSPALKRLYARIPKVEGCRTGCSDCCGPVPLIAEEARAVKHFNAPVPDADTFMTPTKPCNTCGYSTPDGCAIYADRPFMCRLFGASVDDPLLRCPHGARPKRPLSREAASEMTAEYVGMAGGA